MGKEIIATQSAPAAIGTYSQAVKVGNTVYISGQIPLDPKTMELISSDVCEQIGRVFENIKAICHSAGGELSDIVKLNVSLTDLSNFPLVNEVMETYFEKPYPARAAVGVVALPKSAAVEIEAILMFD